MAKNDVNQEIEKLFEAGVHMGHKKNRLHPKAKKYVYKIINGTAIIDLTQTVLQLNKAKEFVRNQAKEGKIMMVVATKKIINQHVHELCEKHSIPYITLKWMPGLLTNYETIHKNVKKLITLEEEKLTDTWEKYVKHEKVAFEKQIVKLRRFYGGMVKLLKKPDFLFVVDLKREKNALIEAKKNNIPVVSLLDTNVNPNDVEYPIVGNDDSASAAQYIVNDIINTYTKEWELQSKTKEQKK